MRKKLLFNSFYPRFTPKSRFYLLRDSLANEVQSMRPFFLKQAGPFVFRVHTSRSHFTANSGYKETPTTPSVTNSGLDTSVTAVS